MLNECAWCMYWSQIPNARDLPIGWCEKWSAVTETTDADTCGTFREKVSE